MEDHAPLDLAALHARLRVQRRTTLAALGLALGALALAGLALARDDRGAAPAPGELRARRFVLVDGDGRAAGTWETDAGRTVLALAVPGGGDAAVARAPEPAAEPGPERSPAAGPAHGSGPARPTAAAGSRRPAAPALRLEVSAVHGPVLEAVGARGRLRYAETRTGPGLELAAGSAVLDLRCIDGRPYVGMLGDGPGQLDLWPDSLGLGGVHLFGLRDDAFAPGLHIADAAHGRSVHVGLDADRRLVARSLDAEGRETHRHDLGPAR